MRGLFTLRFLPEMFDLTANVVLIKQSRITQSDFMFCFFPQLSFYVSDEATLPG